MQPYLEEHVRVFGDDVDVPELDLARRPPGKRVRGLWNQLVARSQPCQRVQREHAADGAKRQRQALVVRIEQDRRLVNVQSAITMGQHVMPERREVLWVQPR